MEKKIVLKSIKPEEYRNVEVTCRVIENADVNAYLATIPEERSVRATKVSPVEANPGQVGEKVHTVLLTERDGKVYILSEDDNEVRQREVEGQMCNDIIVTNIHSTSNEHCVVKANKFPRMYVPNNDGTFTPQPDEREFVQVDEDIIIKSSRGSNAICLKGSYIVIYNAEENDFNTLEQGAMKSTYRVSTPKQKT